jgi:hypothetical protein
MVAWPYTIRKFSGSPESIRITLYSQIAEQ